MRRYEYKAYRFVAFEKYYERDSLIVAVKSTIDNLYDRIEVVVNNITFVFLIDERKVDGMLTIFAREDGDLTVECPCEYIIDSWYSGFVELTNDNSCKSFYSDDLRDWREYGTFDKDELIKWIKEEFPVSAKQYLDKHPDICRELEISYVV